MRVLFGVSCDRTNLMNPMTSIYHRFRYWKQARDFELFLDDPWQHKASLSSEELYWWIDERVAVLGRWVDSVIGRILFATIAAVVTVYGYRQPEGTFLRSISPELFGIVLTAV